MVVFVEPPRYQFDPLHASGGDAKDVLFKDGNYYMPSRGWVTADGYNAARDQMESNDFLRNISQTLDSFYKKDGVVSTSAYEHNDKLDNITNAVNEYNQYYQSLGVPLVEEFHDAEEGGDSPVTFLAQSPVPGPRMDPIMAEVVEGGDSPVIPLPPPPMSGPVKQYQKEDMQEFMQASAAIGLNTPHSDFDKVTPKKKAKLRKRVRKHLKELGFTKDDFRRPPTQQLILAKQLNAAMGN